MTTTPPDPRVRIAQAARDHVRMREIAAGFRAANPDNPDCDLLERAADALTGVHTRLLAASAGADPTAEEPATKSRIQQPDRVRRHNGETREQIHGPAGSGSIYG